MLEPPPPQKKTPTFNSYPLRPSIEIDVYMGQVYTS